MVDFAKVSSYRRRIYHAEAEPESGEGEDVEKYKKEIDDLKEEIETLKKD